jgi:hypothetical protein
MKNWKPKFETLENTKGLQKCKVRKFEGSWFQYFEKQNHHPNHKGAGDESGIFFLKIEVDKGATSPKKKKNKDEPTQC